MCDHDQACYILLKRLKFLDNRQYNENPTKARAHPKFSIGVKEVKRKIMYKNIKAVLVANDINQEEFHEKTNIDFNLEELCKENNILFIKCLTKKVLAKIMKKTKIVSCIGILSIEGAEKEYDNLRSMFQISDIKK
uniref:Ribosomal_L7Ae domain-containing protein n=1 Tax=Parastrongyloides trichosuri TaxID=131310 RepID=A0A0N4Z6P9_PARTI